MSQQLITQQQYAAQFQQALSGSIIQSATTGNDTMQWSEEYEVTRLVKRAKNGYFFVITVNVKDDVHYRVWKGGWFPYVVAKAFKAFPRDINGRKSTWNTVTKRSHLPATLGSAYEMIDKAIKGDMEDHDHNLYIKELLVVDPENLKMIGGLEKLQEGDVDAPEMDPNVGSSNAARGVYSNNIAFSSTSAEQLGATKIDPWIDFEKMIADRVRKAAEEHKEEILALEQQTKDKGEVNAEQ